MSTLEAEAAADKKKATDSSMRTAFGPGANDPATIASSRDAQARLNAIDLTDRYAERNVSDMLTTATQLGDVPLRQAIALKAHQSGWAGVVQQWKADASSTQVEALDQLSTAEPFNITEMLKFAMPLPVELSHVRNDSQIREIAASDPDPSSPPATMESRVAAMNARIGR